MNLANFLKKPSCRTPANGWFWILNSFQFYMSHSIIHLIYRNSKKRNNYFLNVFNRISTSENYRFENATFRYIFSRGARLRIEIENSDSLQVSIFMVLEFDFLLCLPYSYIIEKFLYSSFSVPMKIC